MPKLYKRPKRHRRPKWHRRPPTRRRAPGVSPASTATWCHRIPATWRGRPLPRSRNWHETRTSPGQHSPCTSTSTREFPLLAEWPGDRRMRQPRWLRRQSCTSRTRVPRAARTAHNCPASQPTWAPTCPSACSAARQGVRAKGKTSCPSSPRAPITGPSPPTSAAYPPRRCLVSWTSSAPLPRRPAPRPRELEALRG